MKLETFFEKFELFAEAPDAVARMREVVLELAVRGRLVEQNPCDEAAEVMMQRITDTAKTRHNKNSREDDFETPFSLPEGWAWIRLPRVLKKLTDGTHHSPPNGSSGDFMYVTAKNIKNEGVMMNEITYVSQEIHQEIYSRCDPSFGDILYIKDGATTGVATINQLKEPFSMLSSVALLKPSEAIFNRYLLWAVRSPFFYRETRGAMKGAAITRVTLSVMAESLLPLPPLAEQKRIVAKVDELMALCDQLEAQQQERQAQHAALVQASLARFTTTPTPANLQFLFHPSYTVSPADLRKTILTLAVQGKLVPQESEPLLGSLESILAEASVNGVSKGPTADPSAVEVLRISAGTSREDFYVNEEDFKHVDLPANEVKKFQLAPGDLLACRFNGNLHFVGRFSLYRGESRRIQVNPDKLIRFRINTDLHSPRYVCYAMNAAPTREAIEAMCATTAGNIGLSAGRLKTVEIPLPPLAEQRRIVAKVDELMALVDDLETQLAASRTVAHNLLAALVRELTTNP